MLRRHELKLQCGGTLVWIFERVCDMRVGQHAERILWWPLDQEYSLGVLESGMANRVMAWWSPWRKIFSGGS